MSSFSPTYDNLSEREPWRNKYLNALIDDLATDALTFSGENLASPFTLAQNINGDGNDIFGFKLWLGSGAAGVGIRDVCGYGARGDDSTDDTAAIQAAIDDCPVTGGCILFPPGKYIISNAIEMTGSDSSRRENITLMGFGMASQIIAAPGSAYHSLIHMGRFGSTVEGMCIRDLYVQGIESHTVKTTGRACIRTAYTGNSRVLGCTVEDSCIGIELTEGPYALIRNCFAIDCYIGFGQFYMQQSTRGLMTHSTVSGCSAQDCGFGVMLNSGHDASFVDCDFKDNYDGGFIFYSPEPGQKFFNTLIASCRFHDAANQGESHMIQTDTAGHSAGHGDFENISIRNCNITTGAHANAGHGIYLNWVIEGINICGNHVHNCEKSGIMLDGSVRYGVIANNTVFSNSESGIRIEGSTTPSGWTTTRMLQISNNACRTNTVYGIYIDDEVSYVEVLANVCSGNGTDVHIDDTTSTHASHNLENF